MLVPVSWCVYAAELESGRASSENMRAVTINLPSISIEHNHKVLDPLASYLIELRRAYNDGCLLYGEGGQRTGIRHWIWTG